MKNNGNGSATLLPDTEAGRQVRRRLTDEHTLQGLDHLLAKIDTLEKAVDNLAGMMAQGPGLMAMGADMLDETYREAEARGVNIDERLHGALALAEKLTAPAMMEKLESLLKLTDQLPGLVAMKVDALDEMYREADARGVSVDERLGATLQMVEKLTAPEMMEKLDSLLKLGDQMPGLVAMGVDILDEGMRDASKSGFDPASLVETAQAASRALTEAKAEPPANVGGIFAIFRVLRDPERQRGIGFLMNFLKYFGKNI